MSDPFPYPLEIQALPKRELLLMKSKTQLFRVQRDFVCVTRTLGTIVVPEGMLTDFASIPSLAKWIIDDDDPDILYPSLPHDYLYSMGGRIGDRVFTRAQADESLKESMTAIGAPWWKIQAVHKAVWAGGWRHFKPSPERFPKNPRI